MASLPQPRAFLTSLINAISAIPLSQPEPLPYQHHEPSNPLKAVPPSYRPLLATLHVLFPTVFLPALDLLDRRLVTRLWLVPKRSDEERRDSPADSASDDGSSVGGVHEGEAGVYGAEAAAETRRSAESPSPELGGGAEGGEQRGPVSRIFVVRSSQSTHQRRRRDVLLGGVTDDPGQKMYVVRLGAWNCTCAAFAFAAFPGGSGHASYGDSPDGDLEGDLEGSHAGEWEEGGWKFGGMSLDGVGEGSGVPCCKHLLACLLAERWTAGFDGYIEERKVGRNELAGIVADI